MRAFTTSQSLIIFIAKVVFWIMDTMYQNSLTVGNSGENQGGSQN